MKKKLDDLNMTLYNITLGISNLQVILQATDRIDKEVHIEFLRLLALTNSAREQMRNIKESS